MTIETNYVNHYLNHGILYIVALFLSMTRRVRLVFLHSCSVSVYDEKSKISLEEL